ncbi:MAG: hypothetical protein K2X47_19870, partial [Bdellovibrionales bacterium]|nr:hypothetical protein [Bdellovibrionales bacterium]
VVINGTQYFLTKAGDLWCSQIGTEAPNCALPKVNLVLSESGKSKGPGPAKAIAAIEFVLLSNGDAVIQILEVKKPLNAEGLSEFKSKGALKVRIYGRQMENGEGNPTWSMTADAVKFDAEYGEDGENISEGIEVRHEKSPLYDRATRHISLEKPIQLKPSWDKDWSVNCVEGVFSSDDQTSDEKQ